MTWIVELRKSTLVLLNVADQCPLLAFVDSYVTQLNPLLTKPTTIHEKPFTNDKKVIKYKS